MPPPPASALHFLDHHVQDQDQDRNYDHVQDHVQDHHKQDKISSSNICKSPINICTCMSRSPTMKADPWQYPTFGISVVRQKTGKFFNKKNSKEEEKQSKELNIILFHLAIMDAVSFHDIEKCFLTNAPSFSKELVLRICSGGDGVCSGSCEFGVGGKAQ